MIQSSLKIEASSSTNPGSTDSPDKVGICVVEKLRISIA